MIRDAVAQTVFLTTIDFRPKISRANVKSTRESIKNTRETSGNFTIFIWKILEFVGDIGIIFNHFKS